MGSGSGVLGVAASGASGDSVGAVSGGVEVVASDTDSEMRAGEEEEEGLSDVASVTSESGEESLTPGGDLYSLREIVDFLRVSKGKKKVRLESFFPDSKKFLKSAKRVQATADLKVLSPKKRYRLKKWVTLARKDLAPLLS